MRFARLAGLLLVGCGGIARVDGSDPMSPKELVDPLFEAFAEVVARHPAESLPFGAGRPKDPCPDQGQTGRGHLPLIGELPEPVFRWCGEANASFHAIPNPEFTAFHFDTP